MKATHVTGRDQLPKGIAAAVADALRTDITLGQLAPGSPLRQEEIAGRFQISQIPVREALRTLAGEGLISISPNRGAVVASLNAKDISELMAYRILMEGKLLEWAVPNTTAEVCEHLDHILVSMKSAELTRDLNQVVHLREDFHLRLYNLADRPFFLASIRAVRSNLNRYLLSAWKSHGKQEDPSLEHARLLELCRRHDTRKAVALLREHIQEAERLILLDMTAKEGR